MRVVSAVLLANAIIDFRFPSFAPPHWLPFRHIFDHFVKFFPPCNPSATILEVAHGVGPWGGHFGEGSDQFRFWFGLGLESVAREISRGLPPPCLKGTLSLSLDPSSGVSQPKLLRSPLLTARGWPALFLGRHSWMFWPELTRSTPPLACDHKGRFRLRWRSALVDRALQPRTRLVWGNGWYGGQHGEQFLFLLLNVLSWSFLGG